MGLSGYTTEELKAELKRRADVARQQKAEEMKTAKRCRNCKHCQETLLTGWRPTFQCKARTWGKKYLRHYIISPSTKACDKFERKEE